MSKIDEVLNSIYNGDCENDSGELCPDCLREKKQSLLEIIIGEKPKRIDIKEIEKYDHDNINYSEGFNQGADEYEKKIQDLFK